MSSNMTTKAFAVFAALVPAASIAQTTASTPEPSASLIPTKAQEDYLRKSVSTATRGPGPTATVTVEVKSLPSDSVFADILRDGKTLQQPLQSANEVLILLDPKLSGDEIQVALSEHQLDVIKTLPAIGGVIVDVSRRLGPGALTTAAATVSAAKSSKLSDLVDTLAKDKRFVAVTPNAVISTFVLRSAVKPVLQPPLVTSTSERTDWGITDAKFDKVWGKMTSKVKIGVIDVGFANHEDLDIENALGSRLSSNDHGNHVSGIMCAKHNNIGVRGALKNCTVVASSGTILLTGDSAVQGGGVSPFMADFGEYVATLLEFVEKHPDVRVVNMSLGYNWMPNFNIDPRAQGEEDVRNDIKNQGRFVETILAVAKQKNVAVVMAAGNDSRNLKSPLDADLASPFNYGSRMMEALDGWSNGVIVEAYDKQHRRAAFSNVNGHVACPGVDILSTLASGPSSYGEMSGTSMASPYCAAGLLTILTLRPDLSLREAIDCMRSGPEKIEGRVPRLDVDYAVSKCKTDNAK